MYPRQIPWQLLALATALGPTSACSGDGSDDHSGAGSSNGGSLGTVAGASNAGSPAGGQSAAETGGTSGTAGQAGAVDCEAVCAHVKVLCPDRTDISDVWLSACKSVCDARVQLTPEVARQEQECVEKAATCNASITCVAMPG
jgi:hypothetical protein